MQYQYVYWSASITYSRLDVFISLFKNPRFHFNPILLCEGECHNDLFYLISAVSHVVSIMASNEIPAPIRKYPLRQRLHLFCLTCFQIFIIVVHDAMSFPPFQKPLPPINTLSLHSTDATITPFQHSCSRRVLKHKQKPH